jgi:hypothetical protein
MNVLECQEFRELLLYLGEDKIDDSDLPHRTKMTLMILEEFKAEHKRICGDLQVCSRKFFKSSQFTDLALEMFVEGCRSHLFYHGSLE